MKRSLNQKKLQLNYSSTILIYLFYEKEQKRMTFFYISLINQLNLIKTDNQLKF